MGVEIILYLASVACTENLFKAVPVGAGAVFCNLTNKRI